MDTANYSLNVQEFTPSYDIKQMKRSIRDQDSNRQSQMQESKNSEERQEGLFSRRMQQSTIGNDLLGQTSQIKSLIKSFSNGNFQFYDNLHKKYFDKAKEEQKNSKPPSATQNNLNKSEKDIFAFTNKTSTMLGCSQLNYTSSQNLTKFKNS